MTEHLCHTNRSQTCTSGCDLVGMSRAAPSPRTDVMTLDTALTQHEWLILPTLRNRSRQPELMDQPGLDPRAHRAALAGLRRINWWSRSALIGLPAILQLARDLGRTSLRVLDLGCGGADVAIGMARGARKRGLSLELTGCDLSPFALEVASDRARHAGITAEFRTLNVLQDPLPTGFDVVMCSLFLHHFDRPDAVSLLCRMSEATRHLMLVNDLLRSRCGYLLACLGCYVLTRSHVVHVDGPLSVRAAFGRAEIGELAQSAGLSDFQITRHWPERFLLSWRQANA